MQQEPAHIVELFSAFRRVDGQCKVSATFSGTVTARRLSGRNVLAIRTSLFSHSKDIVQQFAEKENTTEPANSVRLPLANGVLRRLKRKRMQNGYKIYWRKFKTF
jgi:LDH2 family malate/lactate/ureidoglycolate dehydrogenase